MKGIVLAGGAGTYTRILERARTIVFCKRGQSVVYWQETLQA